VIRSGNGRSVNAVNSLLRVLSAKGDAWRNEVAHQGACPIPKVNGGCAKCLHRLRTSFAGRRTLQSWADTRQRRGSNDFLFPRFIAR
jgi:hypothetical protein